MTKVLFAVVFVSLLLCGCSAERIEAKGSSLREIIEGIQKAQVRPSYGELAHECFTWDDLERFEHDKTAERIVQQLRRDQAFLSALGKLREMNPEERAQYLLQCRRPLRPTWAAIGEISPRGTTEAGQRCEKIIADRVTDLAVELLGERRGAK